MRPFIKKILNRFTIFLAVALVASFLLGMVFSFYGVPYTEKSYNTVAPAEVLVESFANVVHTRKPGDKFDNPAAFKWSSTVRFAFFEKVPDWHRLLFRRYLELLPRLTGLVFEEVPENPREANYHIYFAANKKSLARIGTLYGFSKEKMKAHVQKVLCFSIPASRDSKTLTGGIVVISGRENTLLAKRCVAEEMAHSFGIVAHNAQYIPSIFSDYDGPEKLSINDMILVRTLYDKRIKAGITREQTTPIAREIITELVAAVKERGEEALYQR